MPKDIPALPTWANGSAQDDLVCMIGLLTTEEEIRTLMSALFTPEEMLNVANRLRAACLLFEGQTTVEVKQTCPDISRSVISRANQTIVKRNNGATCRPLFERFKRHRLG
jgi:uncharacterized protein YerC